jgi:hypothetical protein
VGPLRLRVAALSEEVIQLCFAAVVHPDEDEQYMRLKEDLLQQHSLTKYQRNEQLHAVGGLGSRQPTQLLAEMMELCPDDEEASCFFVFLFLQRLPAWLRVQLEADDQADIRQLATRAGRLFALHGHKQAETVVVVDTAEEQDDSAAINAVQASSQRGSQHGGQRASQGRGQRGTHRGSQQNGGAEARETTPCNVAAITPRMCWAHWQFGDQAYACKGTADRPCSWQGN